jgi:hypothetical protein
MLVFEKTRQNTVFPLVIQKYHYTQRQLSQHETSRPHAADKGEESDESVFYSPVGGGDPNREVGLYEAACVNVVP